MYFQGHKIDLGTKIADLGVVYGDTIDIVQSTSVDLESKIQEYEKQVGELQAELVEVKTERDQLQEEVKQLKERLKELEEIKPKPIVHKNPFERSYPKTNPFAQETNEGEMPDGDHGEESLADEETPNEEIGEVPEEGVDGAQDMNEKIPIEEEATVAEIPQEESIPVETAEEVERRERREATRRERREARQAAHRAAKARPAQRGIWELTDEDKDTARSIFTMLTHQDEDSLSDAVTGWCWDQGLDDATIHEM